MDYNGKTIVAGATLAATGATSTWIITIAGVVIILLALVIRFGWRKNKDISRR